MDKTTSSMLSIVSLMVGLFLGVNYMVGENRDGRWLMFAIVFLVVAVFLWWWMGSQERRSQQEAEKLAQEKMRLAEAELQKSRAKVQEVLNVPAQIPTNKVIEPIAEPEPVVEAVAPVAEPEPVVEAVAPVVEVVAPVAEPEPVVEAVAPVAEPEPVVEVVAPVVEPEPVVEAVAPVAEPEPVVEAVAPVAEPEPVVEAVAPVAEPEPVVEATTEKPAKKSSSKKAVDADKDDFTKLEGIGPYYRDILYGAGITKFAQLANLSREQIDEIIKNAGGRRSMTTMSWSEQAELASKGEWEALATLQATLDGGRR